MLKSPILKTLCAVSLATACLGVAVGCSSDGHTGGVAATVNGVEIPEDKVTDAIKNLREQQGLTNKDAWGEWMVEYNYTPETVRETYLDNYIEQEVLKQTAGELEVTVEDDEIDTYVEDMRSRYDSEEAWQDALDSVGMTEDEYRENIETALYRQGVEDALLPEEGQELDELGWAQAHLSDLDGVKRSSHILFAEDDEETAKEVLDKINSGELDFAAAATEYSTDTASAEDGGNVGWGDPIGSFVDDYEDALKDLSLDQVSDLVHSDYGIHIIKVTEVFQAPETLTSLSQLPEEFMEYIQTGVENQNDASALYSDWLEKKKDELDIVINDMPSNVPYNIDMTKYETAAEEEAVDEEGELAQDEFMEDLGEEATYLDEEGNMVYDPAVEDGAPDGLVVDEVPAAGEGVAQ